MRTAINLIFLLSALTLAGCSTTKRLGDGEVLYTGVKKIKIDHLGEEDLASGVGSAVKNPLSVKPNNPLFSPYVRTPIPTGLWAWNYLYTERTTGFRAWLYRRLAKQPVLMSDVQPELRVQLVEQILANHGYFGSDAAYEIIQQKNPKKQRVTYQVTAAEPWYYSRVAFPEPADTVTRIINEIKDDSFLHPGQRYDIDTLSDERVRITNDLRNRSFYYFRPDYIEYQADTLQKKYNMDLRMVMAQGIPPAALQPYDVGDLRIEFYNSDGGEMDSLEYAGSKLVFQQPLKIRKKVLTRNLHIRPGEPARLDSINRTLTDLTRLGIFRYVNLQVTPLDSLGPGDRLDMTLAAAFDSPLQAEFEADFSSKSNSFVGPGATFSVRHNNIFRGAEVLAVNLYGSYEWQTGNTRNQTNTGSINSYEFGATASLTIPRLIAPKFMNRGNRYPAHTTIQLGASVLNRPKYFTMFSYNGSFAYDFQTSPYSYHNWTVFKLVYNKLSNSTEEFNTIMAQNPVLAMSFQNQFIPSASYTYTYDHPYRGNRDRLIWQSTLMSAGNLFSGIWAAFGSKEDKKIFGVPFSQFVKGSTELKYYYAIGDNNTLASRILLGAAYPYGNSSVIPYSEQFYAGGANSIRAFTVRSIGPGSYTPDPNDNYGYFDQTGEFRLELNTEFRYRIVSNLYGAAFLDAGNIWLLKSDPARPGGSLSLRRMWRQLAVGTGAGLRYDLNFLVIRADLGIGIHAPYDTGKSGYYNIPRFKDGLGFHLAIGYPF